MLVVGAVLVVLGVWLVASGVLLFANPRPKCWTVGKLTHMVAGGGFFLVIAALILQTQVALKLHPGHGAMEGAAGVMAYLESSELVKEEAVGNNTNSTATL